MFFLIYFIVVFYCFFLVIFQCHRFWLMFVCTKFGSLKSLDHSLYKSFQIDMFNVNIIVKLKKKLAKTRLNIFFSTVGIKKRSRKRAITKEKHSYSIFGLSFARHQRFFFFQAFQGYKQRRKYTSGLKKKCDLRSTQCFPNESTRLELIAISFDKINFVVMI